jgi:predicted nucleic acid-binding protein
MIVSPVNCVVDANVVIKLVITEIDSDKAHALFAHLIHDPQATIHVPDFCHLECANILWKLVRRGTLTIAAAKAHLTWIKSLALQVMSLTSLVDEALEIAATHDTSVYDATYITASRVLDLPLVTADEKLVNKIATTFPKVLLLNTLSIPSPPSATTP